MQDLSLIHISKWQIIGFENYYFTTDKKLFNSKTNRFSKKVVKRYTAGYNLNGKFITLKNLKPMIELIEFIPGRIEDNWLNDFTV